MGKKPTINNLTVRQEKFCLEFAKSGDARESFKKAGYKYKNENVAAAGAARLMNDPRVKERLRSLHQKAEDDSIASIQEIKQRLTAILRQLAEEEVLMTESVEKGVTETVRYKKKADLRTAVKAAELLGKMAGAFTENVNHLGAVPVVIKDDVEE